MLDHETRDEERMRVVLVCADAIWEHALTWLLRSAGCEVVRRARDLHRAEEYVADLIPDALVIDVDSEDAGDPRLLFKEIRTVRRMRPSTRIVVSCRLDDHATHDAAVAGGAAAVESRDDALALADAVHHAVERKGAADPPALTLRQLEILRLVAEGRTNREVARSAWVTEETVKFHLANIYRRLGVHNRAAATAWAIANGVTTGEISTSGRGRTALDLERVVD